MKKATHRFRVAPCCYYILYKRISWKNYICFSTSYHTNFQCPSIVRRIHGRHVGITGDKPGLRRWGSHYGKPSFTI